MNPTGPSGSGPARAIDLNADLGEGFGPWRMGDDDALLDIVTSANVACGFHAGDARTMRRTCEAAAARGVVVGAHVSYRDLQGFGRRDLAVDPAELTDDLLYQIGALDAVARAAGTRVRYVKAHGALYNRCAHDESHAAALVRALVDHGRGLPLLVAPGSMVATLATAAGVPCPTEGFADRAYRGDGTLVPRDRPGAVHGPAASLAQAVGLAVDGRVTTIDGAELALAPASICVHGDTPGAVATALALRQALAAHGVELQSFVARA